METLIKQIKSCLAERDVLSRLTFKLQFKNASYKIIADPVLVKNNNQLYFDGRYAVEIIDGEGGECNMIFKLSIKTGEWIANFQNELHPGVIKAVSEAMSNLNS